MKISDFTQGRDNNFNLIRVLAAYAVLVTHSFALAIGTPDAEPFRETLGMTMGSIAVDIFFVTSGFLVTASLLTRQSTIEFVWARTLRIVPALLVMLLLTVFGLGLFFTTKPWPAYFSDPKLVTYFVKCLTLIGGVAYELPGVFETNPYRGAVNGSLWTMPHEIRMYAILAATWVVLGVLPASRPRIFKALIMAWTSVAGFFVFLAHFHVVTGESPFFHLFFMFFTGSTFFILKDRITLSPAAFITCVTAMLLSMCDPRTFFVVYMLTLAYILFYFAYVPSRLIHSYNRLGDYSYGIYIYAFPVQQSVAALWPGVSVLSMILISTLVTLTLSVLSWHLLEKHALRLKSRSIHHTGKLFFRHQPLAATPPRTK